MAKTYEFKAPQSPTSFTATPNIGGSLAAGTYYFRIMTNWNRPGDTASEFRCHSAWGTEISATTTDASINNETFVGTGLDDAESGGTYSAVDADRNYIVEIDATGTPDTFKWSDNGGSTWTTGVAITGSAQTLSNGVTITFVATTGHTLADQWTFTANAPRKKIDLSWDAMTDGGATTFATTYYIGVTNVALGSNGRYTYVANTKGVSASKSGTTSSITTMTGYVTSVPIMTDELSSTGFDYSEGVAGDPRNMLIISGGTTADPITPADIQAWMDSSGYGAYATVMAGSNNNHYYWQFGLYYQVLTGATDGYFLALNDDIDMDCSYSDDNVNVTYGKKITDYVTTSGCNVYWRNNQEKGFHTCRYYGNWYLYDTTIKGKETTSQNANYNYFYGNGEIIQSSFANFRICIILLSGSTYLLRDFYIPAGSSKTAINIGSSNITIDNLVVMNGIVGVQAPASGTVTIRNPKLRSVTRGFYIFNGTDNETTLVNPEITSVAQLFEWQQVNNITTQKFILKWPLDVKILKEGIRTAQSVIAGATIGLYDINGNLVSGFPLSTDANGDMTQQEVLQATYSVLEAPVTRNGGFQATATGGSTTTLTDTTKSWTVNAYVNQGIFIRTGTNAGEFRIVQSNTSNTITVTQAFSAAIDSTSAYSVSNEWYKGQNDGNSLSPYTIIVSAPGYETYKKTFNLDEPKKLVIKLRRSPYAGADAMGRQWV